MEWGLAIQMMVATKSEDSLIVSTVGSPREIVTGQSADREFTDGREIVRRPAVDERGELALISLDGLEIERRMRFQMGQVLFLDMSPKEDAIAFCASGVGYVSKWPTHDLSGAIPIGSPPLASAMFFSHDGGHLIRVAGFVDHGRESFLGDVFEINGGTWRPVAKLEEPEVGGYIFSAAQDLSRKSIAISGKDGHVTIWRIPH